MNQSYPENRSQDNINKALAPLPPLTEIPQNIPYFGSNTFIARSQDLEKIDEYLENSPTSITGMEGVGKTELVVQYALRYQQKYPGGICWLDAGRNDLVFQTVSFCISLGVNPPDGFTPIDKLNYCWSHWIEGNALIVFDNVQSYQAIKAYLPPQNDQFKVIVTSHKRLGNLKQLKLKEFKPKEALQLLIQIVGEERVNRELDIANELCEYLGYLPLSLVLVGSYLNADKLLTIKKTLRLLRNRKAKAEALLNPDGNKADMTLEFGVASAFELSWSKLSHKGQRLGCYLSLFKSELFDWSWVESGNLYDQEDLNNLRDDQLVKFNLLQVNKDQEQQKTLFRYHPLISRYFGSKLKQLKGKGRVIDIFCAAIVEIAEYISESRNRAERKEFLMAIPHLKTIATEISVVTELSDEIGYQYLIWPFSGLGEFYRGQKDHQETEKWYQQCLLVCKKLLGEEHHDVAGCMNNLALLYQSQQKYDLAEPLYQQAFAIWEKVIEEEHLSIAASMSNFGGLYEAQKKYDLAEPLYLKSLTMYQNLLGEENLDVALSINNLGNLYFAQEKYDLAEPLYRKSLTMYHKFLGEEHPDLAISMINLANLYQAQKKYDLAEPLLKEAMIIYKNLFGPKHPEVANTMVNLAGMYKSQGRYDEAGPFYLQALALYQNLLGNEHSLLASTMGSLGNVYYAQERYSEAEPLYLHSLAIYQKLLGDEHLSLASAMNDLALLYEAQERYSEAEPLYLKALSMYQKLLGDEHPDLATSINNLASLYDSQERYDLAEPLYQQALDMSKKLLGDEHPHVAASMNNLANLYNSQKKYDLAKPLYQEAVKIFEKAVGKNHPWTIKARQNYYDLLEL